MQKGARSEEVGMQHWTVSLFQQKFSSAASALRLRRGVSSRSGKLTVRVETLAAHVPRAKIVRTAGKNPRFADGDVVVEWCS